MCDDALLTVVRAHMGRLSQAGPRQPVGNAECTYSFDSPFSAGGLFVNLQTFGGCGADFLAGDAQRSGCALSPTGAGMLEAIASPRRVAFERTRRIASAASLSSGLGASDVRAAPSTRVEEQQIFRSVAFERCVSEVHARRASRNSR